MSWQRIGRGLPSLILKAACFLVAYSVLSAQQVDRIIPISDTVAGGATARPAALVLSPAGDKLYCVGADGWAAVLDCASNSIVKDIPVPAYCETEWPAKDPVWSHINNKAYIPTAPGITIVDGAGDSVLTTLRIPRQYGFNWSSKVYNDSQNCLATVEADSYRLLVIDGAADTVRARLALARRPIGVVWNPRHNRYYVVQNLYPNDSLYLTVFDARADTVLDSFPLLVMAWGVALEYVPTGDKLYIGTESSLLVIDCGPDTVRTRLPFAADDLVWSSAANKLYCFLHTGLGDTAKVVDCSSDTLLRTIRVVPRVGSAVYAPGVNKLFVTNIDSLLGVIDCETDSLVAELSFARGTSNVVWNEPRRCAYVATRTGVVTIDGVSNQIRSRVSVGVEDKYGFIWNPLVGKFYVRNRRRGMSDLAEIIVIDGETGRFIKRFPVGHTDLEESRLVLDPTGTKLYCPNSADGTISVIDCASDSVIKTIRTSPVPYMLGVNPEDNRLYCTHRTHPGASLSVIDCLTDSVIAFVELPGDGASYPVWYPAVRKVYVQGYWSNSISVIDGATNRLLTVISGFQGYLATPAVCDPERKRLYVAASWYYPGPLMYSIDAVADTILRSYTLPPDSLFWASSAVLNPSADKVYFRAYRRYTDALCVYDCALDTILKIIDLPQGTRLGGYNECVVPVSHPTKPRVYYPCAGSVLPDGRVTDGGVAVIDCNLDSIVAVARYPIPDPCATDVWLDANTGIIYVDGISRIYAVRDAPPGLNGPAFSGNPGASFACFPNPMEGRLTVCARGNLADTAALRIYDCAGRQVRSLTVQSLLSGRAVWQWDGRDQLGVEVPAGAYFLRLKTGSNSASAKVVKLR